MCSRSCGTSGKRRLERAAETLRAAGRQWSYATVATLLDRLETKGLVTSDRRELAFVYRPAISTQEVRQRRLTSLVDKLYQGEPGLLVLHLLKSHPLDAKPGQGSSVRAGPDVERKEEEKKTRKNNMVRRRTLLCHAATTIENRCSLELLPRRRRNHGCLLPPKAYFVGMSCWLSP